MATADAPAAAAVAKAKYLKHNNPPGIFFKDKDEDLYQASILGERPGQARADHQAHPGRVQRR